MTWKRLDKKILLIEFAKHTKEFICLIPAYKGIIALFHIPKNSHGLVLLLCHFVFLLIAGSIFLAYLNTRYQLTSDALRINIGSFSTHQFEFHAKNLSSTLSNVRVKQTWLQKLLNVQEIELFLENKEEETSTIRLKALTPSAVSELQQWLTLHNRQPFAQQITQSKEISRQNYQIPFRRIALSSLLSLNYFFAIPFLLDVLEWCKHLHIRWLPTLSLQNLVIVSIAAPLFFIAYSITEQYLKFGKFSLGVNSEQFFIKNGLFSTDTHIIKNETIRAIIRESSLGMRLLKLSTLSILTGNNSHTKETKSKNYLFPFLKNEELSNYQQQFFPDYSFETVKYSREKIALRIEQLIHAFGFLFCLSLLFFFRKFFAHHLCFLIFLVGTALYGFTNPFFTRLNTIKNGIQIKQGILSHKHFFIKKEHIEYLDICTFQFQNQSHILHATIFLRGIPVKEFKILAPKKEVVAYLHKLVGE